MDTSIHIESAEIVGARLKEARLSAGLSTRKVSELVAQRFPNSPLSHTTIANYERGSGSPLVKNIGILADIYERPLAWFLEKSQPLRGVRYRAQSSRVLVSERHQYEIQAQHLLEGYVKIERRLRERLTAKHKIKQSCGSKSPEALANEIRSLYELKPADPVRSVVTLLEDFGIRVVELQSDIRIDGLAALFGSEFAIVLNPSRAGDRGRLNAAHELAHVLYGDCTDAGKPTRAMDDRAFEFACNLLIPKSELKAAFAELSAVRLVEAKEQFGISMAAMIYRAEKIGIIKEKMAKKLWIQFAKRGWRANEPGVVKQDRATRLEKMIDKAIFQRKITWTEVATTLGISRRELDDRMRMAVSRPNVPEPELEGGSSSPVLRLMSDA